MLSTTTCTRVLDPGELDDALAVLCREPVNNAFIASRVQSAGLQAWRLGGEMWGWYHHGRLEALCYSGANLVPLSAGPEAAHAFAERARRQGRRCSSIVGPAEATAVLWGQLRTHWGPAREVRPYQPLMVADTVPDAGPGSGLRAGGVRPDPYVRRVRKDEMDLMLPACVAMFTEEVGVSPLAGDGGLMYQSRVAELVGAGRSFARIEDGRVVFKAEIGAATPYVCQVQGVWVDPERRGEGLSVTGMAAVLRYALTEVAPLASLYVNDYNAAARSAYRRVGFRDVGAFMSVLF